MKRLEDTISNNNHQQQLIPKRKKQGFLKCCTRTIEREQIRFSNIVDINNAMLTM
jgi:hypothetical protein